MLVGNRQLTNALSQMCYNGASRRLTVRFYSKTDKLDKTLAEVLKVKKIFENEDKKAPVPIENVEDLSDEFGHLSLVASVKDKMKNENKILMTSRSAVELPDEIEVQELGFINASAAYTYEDLEYDPTILTANLTDALAHRVLQYKGANAILEITLDTLQEKEKTVGDVNLPRSTSGFIKGVAARLTVGGEPITFNAPPQL